MVELQDRTDVLQNKRMCFVEKAPMQEKVSGDEEQWKRDKKAEEQNCVLKSRRKHRSALESLYSKVVNELLQKVVRIEPGPEDATRRKTVEAWKEEESHIKRFSLNTQKYKHIYRVCLIDIEKHVLDEKGQWTEPRRDGFYKLDSQTLYSKKDYMMVMDELLSLRQKSLIKPSGIQDQKPQEEQWKTQLKIFEQIKHLHRSKLKFGLVLAEVSSKTDADAKFCKRVKSKAKFQDTMEELRNKIPLIADGIDYARAARFTSNTNNNL